MDWTKLLFPEFRRVLAIWLDRLKLYLALFGIGLILVALYIAETMINWADNTPDEHWSVWVQDPFWGIAAVFLGSLGCILVAANVVFVLHYAFRGPVEKIRDWNGT